MMLRNFKKREGFTLIELMIVVAIIGILAAIAIPNFIKFQLRSKAGEGKVNLAGIRTAEEAYFAEAGTYLEWTPAPNLVPGQVKAPFPAGIAICPVPLTLGTDPGYCFIGWQPEGDVYYSYEVTTNGVAGTTPANQFWAVGVADIDGDGAGGAARFNVWGVNQPDQSGAALAAPNAPIAGTCAAVLDIGSAAAVLGQVGPCDNVDNGRNVF